MFSVWGKEKMLKIVISPYIKIDNVQSYKNWIVIFYKHYFWALTFVQPRQHINYYKIQRNWK